MSAWHDRRLLDLFRIDTPILLAPMAGSGGSALAIAVAKAGGLGSLPCASVSVEKTTEEVATFRGAVAAPLNLNFFAHQPKVPTDDEQARWLSRLAPYFTEFGVDPSSLAAPGGRAPFDDAMCRMVETLKPEVVSFHFGLPERELLARVKATGAKVLGAATTVAEGRWLAEHGVDAVIAQGAEAGGHRGNFLTDDMATQPGLFALVPQMADALSIPVIAAGAIADGRGMAAALTLGASAVQIGTAYLRSDESISVPVHKAALAQAHDDNTAVTNVLTGRPARGLINRIMREVGPLSPDALPFPLAGGALAPMRAVTEKQGKGDFQPLWSGQAGALAREGSAEALTRHIAEQALSLR